MTLRPYHNSVAITRRSQPDGGGSTSSRKCRGSKRVLMKASFSVCVVSLIILAAVPAPQRFLSISTVRRTLAVTDPTSYFEDQPREYYHRFLDGRHLFRRRAQENTNDGSTFNTLNGATEIDIFNNNNNNVGDRPRYLQEEVLAKSVDGEKIEAEKVEGENVEGGDGSKGKLLGEPNVVIVTEHEKKEIEAAKKKAEEEEIALKLGRPVEGNVTGSISTISSPPSISPSLSMRPSVTRTAGVEPLSEPLSELLSEPSSRPSSQPSSMPSSQPSSMPSTMPSSTPTSTPTIKSTENSPNVFAFYVKRTRNLAEDDEQLKRAWTLAWESTGYTPRILTVDDATRHPEYTQFSDAIDAILSTSNVHRPQELKSCYLRYLAMSVVGGGMMVDLDMTPKNLASQTNTTIPNKFTAYCNFETPNPRTDWVRQVETQNGLPCAVVASSNEWLRVGKLMGWVAKQHLDQRVWTDAHALQFLTNFDDVNLVKQEMAQSWRTSGWDRCHFRYV